MTRRILVALTVVLSTIVAPRALADTRVTVHDFYGPNANRVREDVVNLLERQSGITIVSKGQIETAAEKLGVDPFSPEGRKVLSRELQLSAWMTGRVQKQAGKLKLTVVVYDGAQHSRVGRAQLTGSSASKLSAQIKSYLWKKSGNAIMHASAPNGAGYSAVAENVTAASATSSPDMVVTPAEASQNRDDGELANARADGRKPEGEKLRAFIGLGSPYRSLSYHEPVTSNLGNYQLSGAPMAEINVAFHPGRFATTAWPSWFGIDAGAQIALNTPSVDSEGSQFRSRYDAFRVGLVMRVPVGPHYISAFSGYAMNRFSITPQKEGGGSPAPSVDYRTIRSGAAVEFAVSNALMLGADAAWLNFLSVGDIGQWFPRTTAGGMELAMFATYSVTPAVFARASAAYQRTFFDFNSRPGDKNIAGGATDQYLALSLGAGVNL
jgi:hypothetical protein